MSVLGTPWVAAAAARVMQGLVPMAFRVLSRRRGTMFPEFPGDTREITIPTLIAPARAAVYRPACPAPLPPVHVNFHGGGYVVRGLRYDDALCRYLAAEAGVIVVDVDYVVAPQHPFPAPPRQAFDVVQWVAGHGAAHGWDGDRLTIGGQSAGGGLAAAVARQALEQGGPPIALQVLHYAALDLVTPARARPSAIAKPLIRPWMYEIFDNAYTPDQSMRFDRLASPAHRADTADLTGISPALVITPELDRLHAEGRRYAQRLRHVGALVEHRDVLQADHAYDLNDVEKARHTYTLIARCVRRATQPSTPAPD